MSAMTPTDSPHSKLLSSTTKPFVAAGPATGDSGGPTGSKRSYPKGKGSSAPDPKSFNPMHGGKSTFGLGGV